MDKTEKEEAKKLTAYKLNKMKGAKTAQEMIVAWGDNFEGGEIDPGHKELAEKSIFAKKIPDVIADYGNTPHVHLTERGILHPKIKALLHIACHSLLCHWNAIGHWAIMAKQYGATEEEILEAAAVAITANAKAKMIDVDVVMSDVFNNPVFINAKDRTK